MKNTERNAKRHAPGRAALIGESPRLTKMQASDLRRAIGLVESKEHLLSGQLLLLLSQEVPDHPEVMRWSGVRHALVGEWPQAARLLGQAAPHWPDDVALWAQLATAQELAGDSVAGGVSLRQAARGARSAEQWLTLSLEFDRQGHHDDALAAADEVLRLQPGNAVALLQRSRCYVALGQAQAAAADCRALIAAGQLLGRAWFALVDMKTIALTQAEFAQLERQAAMPANSSGDQMLLDFAFGKALEDAGRHPQALAVLQRANAAMAANNPWHTAQFAQHVAAVRAAFAQAPRAAAAGTEVIFLVGLPRSGTTLVEQVVASHSRVEGASELPYLEQVIQEESKRRGQPFPAWVASTDEATWARLGARYLELSARWRASKPIATDKMPGNWLLAGAALAMLPGARFIDCRRDAVETCWSCYKQLFGPGHVNYTYDFSTLASYWHEYDRLSRFWAEQQPERYRVQHYEDLVARPEEEIRALIKFCGLEFEAQNLDFQNAQRAIRTPSALQVRQPMRKTSTPAAGYGALLDPLRKLLQTPG